MRTIKSVLVVLVLFIMAVACRHPEEPKSEIKVAGDSQEIINNGIIFDADLQGESGVQTKTFEFTATGDWSASISETKATTWITLDPSSGGAGDVIMVITVQPNTSHEVRTVTVTIVCGDVTITFLVTQEGIGENTNYLTFTSKGTTEISLGNYGGNAPNVYYSYDKVNWEQWDYSPLSFSTGNDLYIYGDNEKGFSSSYEKYSKFMAEGSKFSVSGNVMSLLGKDCALDMVPDYCFKFLFWGCRLLETAPNLPAIRMGEGACRAMFSGCRGLLKAPEIPAMELGDFCYFAMFANCISLVNPPALPARTLAEYCYASMFVGCSNLMVAPELPAKELAIGCYGSIGEGGMFAECTSLVSAPELLATNLENKCYYEMFRGCTSLVSAPALPATTLAEGCYALMFQGCTSLESVPGLPAKVLAGDCYYGMFSMCTNLVTPPDLPATTLADRCYANMFAGCTSLVSAPGLPATALAECCYSGMFSHCTCLVSPPKLPATTLAEGCYDRMFAGCASLESALELPATTLAKNCYAGMFTRCTGLATAPELPATTLAEGCYSGMFSYCTSLTSAPELRATVLASNCYGDYHDGNYLLEDGVFEGMFSGCTNLVSAPDLPATTMASNCYSRMFSNCVSLVSAPELPATTLAGGCYSSMFSGCTNLVSAPDLPATTMASNCYSRMFSNCVSLVSAPELPATALVDNCYSGMFEGCQSLNYVKSLATDISSSGCVSGWLEGVKDYGTFVKSPEMTSWSMGISGIPVGWMVLNDGDNQEPSISFKINNIGCIVGDEIHLFPLAIGVNPASFIWTSSDHSIVKVSNDGVSMAQYEGVATITVYAGELSASCTITVIHPGEDNGQKWVDLGLPSGIKWATCNVGASIPSDYGDYFAFGETKAKVLYGEKDYIIPPLVNYESQLDLAHDAANCNWGGGWHMPSCNDMDELLSYCSAEEAIQKGVKGTRVTSGINGNSIFLPMAGYIEYDDYHSEGLFYWSSSFYVSGSYAIANYLCGENGYYSMKQMWGTFGMPIRPVTE